MRIWLIKIFCSILYYLGLLHLYLWYVSKFKKNFAVLILTYHRFTESYDGIIDVEADFMHLLKDFKEELAFIKRYFDIVPLDMVVDKLKKGEAFTRPTITITVDDGYKDSYELLFPVIMEEKVPVTVFLTAGFIGTDKRIWIDRLSENIAATTKERIRLDGILSNQDFPLVNIAQKRRLYRILTDALKEMNINARETNLRIIENKLGSGESNVPLMLRWEQVKNMSKNNVSFGAHTMTHPILTMIQLENAKAEIINSKKEIEEKLGIDVKHFAYPNGRSQDFNEELRTFCKHIGFKSVSGYENKGGNFPHDDVFALKRLAAYRPLSLFAFNIARNLSC